MRHITLLLALLLASSTFAEHLPGGNITYRCLGANQHEITLQLWRECSGSPMIGQDLLFSNSCGVSFSLTNVPLISQAEVSPVCPGQIDQTTCNGGSLIGIELYTYRTTLFLSPCALWTVSWNTCCRNTSVNLVGQQGLYIEAKLNNAGGACNNSPVFSDDMPPFVCVDQPVSYDPGVTIDGGQTLRYHLIDARRYTPLPEPVAYQAPYTGAEPFTGMVLDSLTGNITFLPTLQGYVVCVMEVSVYDVNGTWIGSVMRDFPFVVQVCANNVPDASSGNTGATSGGATSTGPYEVTACSASSFCVEITVADADATQELTLTSNVDIALPGATFNVVGTNPAVATICWNTTGIDAGSYNFTIAATDDACPTPGSQTYTYTVIVVEGGFGAGDDASAEICEGTSIDLTTLVTGTAGGTWSDGPVVSAAGEYTYTVASPCGDDVAVFTVSVIDLPNAGTNGSTSVCSNGVPIDLFGELGGNPDTGGTWTEISPGIFEYVVTNSCGSDTATVVVNVVQAPNAGEDSAISVCSNSAPFIMVTALGGTPDPNGTWGTHPPIFDPSVDPSGLYVYTVSGIAPCPSVSALLAVTVNTAPDAGLDNAIGYCTNAASFFMLDSLLGTPDLGGSWTSPNGQPHPPVFVPGVGTPGVHCYAVQGSPPCANDIACLTITELPANDPYCIWLGVANVQQPVIALAPNPSTGRLRIESLRSACTSADVLDVQGRLLWSAPPNASNSFTLELPSSIASGSYLLRVACADGSLLTHRFELQR